MREVPDGVTLAEAPDAVTRRVRMSEARDAAGGLVGLPERVAGHSFFYKNKFCPELKWAFDKMPRMWHITLFFPYAAGGPLYADLPISAEEVIEAKTKQVVMREKGHRMVVIEQSATEDDVRLQMGDNL